MRFFKLPVVVLFVLFFAVASQSRANSVPIRGGSTYGDNTGFNTCVANITDFLSTNVANNCEGFIPTTFTIEGVTYSGAVFAFLEPNGTGFGILDIILLSGNSSLTLSLVNPLLPTGVFMCGSFGDPSNPTVVQDSTPTAMPGLPCTPGSSPSAYGGTLDLANVQANFSATGVTFVNGNSTGLAVFTEHGNILTPEPGSLMLLGVGLLAVGRKFRRTS